MSSTDPSVDDDELSLVNHSDDEMSIHEELHGADDALQKNEEELARQETAAVFRLRFGVFLVLFLAAIAVSVIVYYITSSAAREESKTQFEGAAEKIIESFLEIVDSKLAAVSSLGVASIAHGVDHIRTWPFVTLSSFQQRSATARSQSDALYVHMNPLVREEDRVAWEVFSQSEDANWIAEGIDYQDTVGLFDFVRQSHRPPSLRYLQSGSTAQPTSIWYTDEHGNHVTDPATDPYDYYLPVWQTSPVFDDTLNENLLRTDSAKGALKSLETESVVISEFLTAPAGDMHSDDPRTAFFALLLSTAAQKPVQYQGDPMAQVFYPIFDSFRDDRAPVAVLVAWINWASYFHHILPKNIIGIDVVLQDSCGGVFTYSIHGEQVVPRGKGDQHNRSYNKMKRSASFLAVKNIADGTKYGLPLNQEHCQIQLDVYPSSAFYDNNKTNTPGIITSAVAIIFILTVCIFILYDRLVERRQALVMWSAERTTAIVSNLFPDTVRDRLIRANDKIRTNDSRIMPFCKNEKEDDDAPIADLFPHCTVLFADIAGFTAWSSTRHPAQVFILLESIYGCFDKIAKKRKVFKVETIGDSYVAVTGLPEPQDNHAVIMARFAGDALEQMNALVAKLETTLGPDTGDLRMRVGLHSGPVTAGVLRGERARFQLFGDTVNTASRMESTGIKNRIQMSQATKDILTLAGKEHWTSPRPDPVQAKGKGAMDTYWLTPTSKKRKISQEESTSSETSATSATSHDFQSTVSLARVPSLTIKQDRLVDWMVDMFSEVFKKIVAQRKMATVLHKVVYKPKPGSVPLDDVTEVIVLPRYNRKTCAQSLDYRNIDLGPKVLSQLRAYVAAIASTYHNHPFHCFEHAAHVSMATNKFIKRIVSPDIVKEESQGDLASKLHDYTHGINSDPLTVCAILFSALIHDADHRGVSNPQLIKEEKELATLYGNKSIAEQNSLDISWDLLMTDQFEDMRACLFATQAELTRFRQVVVNVVLATDIFDKELNDLRKNRWNKAFDSDGKTNMSHKGKNDLRATIVIEHIIQASDVSHTMQHWHIYRKWNRRLFLEMHAAYKAGRMGKDPATFWYSGELSFFDNYVIPLAKKLKDCNVFGVSSDECLNYALQNRAEWALKGQQIVAEMMNKVAEPSTKSPTSPSFHESMVD